VGLKLIFAVSALVVVAPVSVESEPEPPSISDGFYFEDIDQAVVPVFPDHACESTEHDNFLKVAALADAEGFPGAELHTAVAVAYAESLGDPEAVNFNRNGSKDSGLWQINSVHGYSDLKKPHVNAQAAFEVWSHSGWTAWYAHTPRGGEYGSGARFQEWLKESQCTIDFYHELMVYYRSYDERSRGEDARFDALPALR
jgi:hypothetical protein